MGLGCGGMKHLYQTVFHSVHFQERMYFLLKNSESGCIKCRSILSLQYTRTLEQLIPKVYNLLRTQQKVVSGSRCTFLMHNNMLGLSGLLTICTALRRPKV